MEYFQFIRMGKYKSGLYWIIYFLLDPAGFRPRTPAGCPPPRDGWWNLVKNLVNKPGKKPGNKPGKNLVKYLVFFSRLTYPKSSKFPFAT